MVDRIATFVDARDLGRLEQRVGVRGKLAVGEKARARAELCLTPRGAFLVAALDRHHGVAIDLLERPDLRYESHALGDRLMLGELALTIAPGKGESARELIGIGRLRKQRAHPEREFSALYHVEEPTPLERAFLTAHLLPDEVLLAWLGGTTRLPIHSEILGKRRGGGPIPRHRPPARADRAFGKSATSARSF
jgi:hypothetical protein